jgi:hypothetical protein
MASPLAALGLGAFVVGTSELVIVGLLDPIAHDAGVSISTAGTLTDISGGAISAFLLAFGVATAVGLFGFGLVSTALQVRVIGLAGLGGDLAASLGVREVALAGALILLVSLPATGAACSLRGAPGLGRTVTTQAPSPS